MEKEELKSQINAFLPDLLIEDTGEWLVVNIAPGQWPDFARHIRYAEPLLFDYMFCITAVDWKTHLGIVYHLTSTFHRHTIVVKSKLDRDHAEIATACRIWRTAEFHEREAAELFGIVFLDHPDLRKLILPDDWEGYPMRKDYEDPVNMIKL